MNILIKLDLLKIVNTFAGVGSAQSCLQGVNVQPAGYSSLTLVATDGCAMAALKPSKTAVHVEDPFEAFTLPSAAIKALSVKCRGSEVAWCVVEADALFGYATTVDTASRELAQVVKHKGTRVCFTPVDTPFPDWRRIIPNEERYTAPLAKPVIFDPVLLKKLTVFGHGLDFHFNSSPSGPSIFRGETADYEAFGLVMPMRAPAKEGGGHTPAWVRPAATPDDAEDLV